jgi:pilus assembly protein CpaB
MNKNAMTLSLLMAGIAVYFVMASVNSIEEDARNRFGNEVTVLVAKDDIKEMSNITDGMIEPRSIPKRFVEPTAVRFDTKVEENSESYASEVKRINGTVAIVPIKKGEQISLNKITEPSMRTGLAPQVAPGKRAITLPAGEIESVGKLVKPGDRVDLIGVIEAGVSSNGRPYSVAKTIMQDVVILAVGRNITNNIARRVDMDASGTKTKFRALTEFDGFSSVTIEVDPSQAQLLAAILATSSNKIILTLRNNDDTDRTNLQSVRAVDALGSAPREPAQTTGTR